jgi:hypothetical protein
MNIFYDLVAPPTSAASGKLSDSHDTIQLSLQTRNRALHSSDMRLSPDQCLRFRLNDWDYLEVNTLALAFARCNKKEMA